MNSLGRYYTESKYSNLLVQQINKDDPKVIIDLGIGAGSLTTAAIKKWNKAKYFGIDIDEVQLKKTQTKLPQITITQGCSLDENISKKLKLKIGTVDVAICNPPYLKIKHNNSYYDKLFENTGLVGSKKLKYLTSDIVFLAQNLMFLKEGGELGIILPDGLLTNHDFKFLRQDLLLNHTIISIIELPSKGFLETEAKTHILILKKGKSSYSECVLMKADNAGNVFDKLTVKKSRLVKRMDFQYWKFQSKTIPPNFTLKSIGVVIVRGKITKATAEKDRIKYFHSTSFKKFKLEINLPKNVKSKYINTSAKKGDILMCRVGKRCVGRFVRIKSGQTVITDCIFRIKVPSKYKELFWATLNSNFAREWIQAHAHGVCAKVISKTDLEDFPIFINNPDLRYSLLN